MMKTLGKVAGGIGLLLTLTSFVTIFLATPTAFFVKLGVDSRGALTDLVRSGALDGGGARPRG